MSLNDKISTPKGIARQLTSPNNFFKRILTKNIPISNCNRGHIVKNMSIAAYNRGHIVKNMSIATCNRGHIVKNMSIATLKKAHNLAIFTIIN